MATTRDERDDLLTWSWRVSDRGWSGTPMGTVPSLVRRLIDERNRLETELADAHAYTAEVALGVAHASTVCSTDTPCVRCQRDTTQVALAKERELLDESVEALREAKESEEARPRWDDEHLRILEGTVRESRLAGCITEAIEAALKMIVDLQREVAYWSDEATKPETISTDDQGPAVFNKGGAE